MGKDNQFVCDYDRCSNTEALDVLMEVLAIPEDLSARITR
jgi:hypothetical protein